jgi:hypothetical protein
LKFAEYMVLFFKVFVLRPGEGAIKKRLIFGIDKEVEVEMIRNDRCRRGVTVYGEPDASTVPQVRMTQFYREVEATQV